MFSIWLLLPRWLDAGAQAVVAADAAVLAHRQRDRQQAVPITVPSLL
jgi:hypothetical protein